MHVKLPRNEEPQDVAVRKVEVYTVERLFRVPDYNASLSTWSKVLELSIDVDIVFVLEFLFDNVNLLLLERRDIVPSLENETASLLFFLHVREVICHKVLF